MSNKLKEVCAYIRVSTGKQEELSPDSQLRLIKEYAQSHNMLLTHVYMEEHGISAKSTKRPAFQDMIAACKDKSHPYDAILLWKFSRFARNMDESTYYKSILRKKCNVDVISISEPIMEGMYGRLIEMVIEWNDEFYLYNLSGEVMRGMTQNALNGGYNANPPIGYTKKKGEVPVVEPDGAAIVRKIYDMFVNKSLGRNEITSILNKQHITTKRGGTWDNRSITYILENPFYIGKIRWNFFDRNKNKRKNAEDVVIVDGQHEPIITEEMFAEAGKRLAEARKRSCYGQKRSVTATKHWLSSMVKCPYCGGSLGYNSGTSKTPRYFNCWKHQKGMCAHSAYINADNLETLVINAVEEFSKEVGTTLYRVTPTSLLENDDSLFIKQELDALSRKERRIKDAYINGIDTLEEYRENKALINNRRSELEEELAKTDESQPEKAAYSLISLNGLVHTLKNPKDDYTTKAFALRNIFDHFVYTKETNNLDCYIRGDVVTEKP